jgi:hypothetical protein
MSEGSKLSRREFLSKTAAGVAGALAVASVPTIAQAAGEGKANRAQKPDVTIGWIEIWSATYATLGFGKTLDQWQQDFISAHPEVNLKIQRQEITGDSTWEQVLATTAQAGGIPDVTICQPYYPSWMVDMVPLAPIDDARAKVGGDKAFSFGAKWQGKEYMNFIYGGAMVPYYNENRLKAAGVEYPKTWDEYIPAGKKVTDSKNNKYAACLILNSVVTWIMWAEFMPLLLQAGAKIVDEKNSPAFNTDEGASVLDFWKAQQDAGIVTDGALTNQDSLAWQLMDSQTTAWFSHMGVWAVGHFKSGGIEFTAKNTVVPKGPKGAQIALGNGTGLAASGKSKALDWAKEWLMYMTAGKGNENWCTTLKTISPYHPVEELIAKQIPEMQGHVDQAKLGMFGFPPVAAWNELTDIVSKYTASFWNGEIKARAAVDSMVSEWNKVSTKK